MILAVLEALGRIMRCVVGVHNYYEWNQDNSQLPPNRRVCLVAGCQRFERLTDEGDWIDVRAERARLAELRGTRLETVAGPEGAGSE